MAIYYFGACKSCRDSGFDKSFTQANMFRAHSKITVIVQPVKKGYSKALADGYLLEVKRLASKQISISQGGFKNKCGDFLFFHGFK